MLAKAEPESSARLRWQSRHETARRHGEEAAYAGVSAHPFEARGRGRKKAARVAPAPWFCGTMRGGPRPRVDAECVRFRRLIAHQAQAWR